MSGRKIQFMVAQVALSKCNWTTMSLSNHQSQSSDSRIQAPPVV